jgi:hypothetical protein
LSPFDNGYQPDEPEESFEDVVAAGVKAVASNCSTNYKEKGDIALINAWEAISLDALTGSNQSGKKY